MKTVTMITLKGHDYAGTRHKPGDRFECEEQHVPILEKLGRAAVIDPDPPKGNYKRRDMRAEK